jgi:hypothetical protein
MKVRVLLLVVSLASLFALFVASGAIIQRDGGPGTQGIISTGPQASGIIITRGGGGPEATGVRTPPHWW